DVLEDQSLTYDVREKTILIGRAKPKPFEAIRYQRGAPQSRIIAGKVTDELGNPLEGVTVTVKGTNVAVQTDATGGYQIEIPVGGTGLLFTIVGFEPSEQAIQKDNIINVAMVPVVDNLDEAVVVAFGTQRKASVIGAITTRSEEHTSELQSRENL